MISLLAALSLLTLGQAEAAADAPPPPVAQAEAPAAPAAPLPTRAPARAGTRQLSLLSAEPLRGGSAGLAWAGWASVGAAWAQGVSEQDDLGLSGDFDWAATELRLGGFWRRPLGTAGPFDLGGRLALSWYSDHGAHWVYSGNHDDQGVELVPSLVLSQRAAGGIFSAWADFPLTATFKRDGGLLFAPRASVAYEAPVYPDLNVGVQAGIGYRAGSGDAPMKDGRADLRFLLVASYQVL